MKPLLQKLEEYITNIKSNPFYNPTDNIIRNDVIQLLHDHYQGNLLQSFLVIEQLNKEKLQKEKNVLYKGVEDGMHGLAILSKHLLEDSNTKKAKVIAKMYFTEDNLAFLINIAKAYFPNAKANNCSANGQWFLNTFKELVKKYKDKYLEGGSSYDWAVSFNHLEYINLILNEDKRTDTK